MKKFTFLAFATLLFLFSCKKSIEQKLDPPAEHVKEWYRVLLIGTDTVTSNSMLAKSSDIDHDDYLEIQLMGYLNGQLVLRVTNPQKCDVDFALEYDKVKPTAISPNRKNNLYLNQVKAGKTETFYITAPLKTGKIRAKALTICKWAGCDPEWLSVNVTADLMAIHIVESTTVFTNGFATVSWTVANPDEVNISIIQKLIGGVWTDIWSATSDKVTKINSISIWNE